MHMPEYLKNFLERCNEAYSKGEVYAIKDYEVEPIEKEFNIKLSTLFVDDSLYDVLYSYIKDKWPKDPFFQKLTSNNTGYGQDIIHEIPMGSMDELKEGDLERWIIGHNRFLVSEKLDGCSIILTYNNGKLVTAATRGHGTKGKDIMRHVRNVSFPKNIDYKDKIIIRGELLFPKNSISTILHLLEHTSGKKQKNGRNTIAGALNSKETRPYIFQQTDFVAYWTSKDGGSLKAFEFLKQKGFITPFYQMFDSDELTDNTMINVVKDRMKNSTYELDGVIITQADHIEEGFISGTINPKCSRKFKLGIYDNVAESTVVGINWQISRWGVFTPVLEIKPVEIAGATITNITAHNYDTVIKSKCGIGAKIKFKRAGLVIPKLEEVLVPSTIYNLPLCKYKIEGVDLIYIWNKDFDYLHDEMCIRSLEYFGSKLDIAYLGYGNCAKIFNDLLKEKKRNPFMPAMIYGLPKGMITKVIGKNGEKLEESLANKKDKITEVQFAAACGSFGPDIGERVLQLVWDKYGTLDDMTYEKLKAIEGFGDSRISQYLEYQSHWQMDKINMELFDYGIVFAENKQEILSTEYSNYNVCFSGVRDKDLAEFINSRGGKASDKWNKDTNYLIIKDLNSTSSKVKKAKDKGCKIITLEEAHAIFYK